MRAKFIDMNNIVIYTEDANEELIAQVFCNNCVKHGIKYGGKTMACQFDNLIHIKAFNITTKYIKPKQGE